MAQPLSNLPVGAKVKFGRYQVNTETPQEIIWKIAAKNHACVPAYPADSVTLITEKIIDLRAFDAKEPSNSDTNRRDYGNNRYSLSNIDQWLNKDSSPWHVATHAADAPPDTSASIGGYNTQYSAKAGFLNLFTADEKAAILNTTIRIVKASLDGGGSEDIARKVFLPSTTEVGLANESGIAEGAKLALFSDSASRVSYLTQQAFDNSLSTIKPSTIDSTRWWWLRTPFASTSYYARDVDTNGALGSYNEAYGGFKGLRPALNLSSTLSASNTTDADGCYTLVFWTPPNISPCIDGAVRSYVDGWAKVDEQKRHVTDIWTKVDGELRKL